MSEEKPQDKIDLCACMGKQFDEPYCPCVMERSCLPRSEQWKAEQIRREEAIKKALPGIFGWQVNGG